MIPALTMLQLAAYKLDPRIDQFFADKKWPFRGFYNAFGSRDSRKPQDASIERKKGLCHSVLGLSHLVGISIQYRDTNRLYCIDHTFLCLVENFEKP